MRRSMPILPCLARILVLFADTRRIHASPVDEHAAKTHAPRAQDVSAIRVAHVKGLVGPGPRQPEGRLEHVRSRLGSADHGRRGRSVE